MEKICLVVINNIQQGFGFKEYSKARRYITHVAKSKKDTLTYGPLKNMWVNEKSGDSQRTYAITWVRVI